MRKNAASHDDSKSSFNSLEIMFIFIFAFDILLCVCWGGWDYRNYVDHLFLLRNDINPYTNISYYTKYPAGYFVFMGILYILGVREYIGIKIVYAVFDFGVMVMISKILFDSFNMTKSRCFLAVIAYYFFPDHIHSLLLGENDVVALFFLLVGFYYFLKGSYSLSSVFLSFGVNFKIFPIFFLIPASIYFIHEGKYKQGILYWLIQGILFVAISSPYLFITPIEYIKALSVNMSRSADGLTYAPYIPLLYSKIEIYDGIFISYMFIFQLCILSFVILFLNKRWIKSTNSQLVLSTLITFSFYPILMNQINSTKFIIIFALAIVVFMNHQSSADKGNKGMLLDERSEPDDRGKMKTNESWQNIENINGSKMRYLHLWILMGVFCIFGLGFLYFPLNFGFSPDYNGDNYILYRFFPNFLIFFIPLYYYAVKDLGVVIPKEFLYNLLLLKVIYHLYYFNFHFIIALIMYGLSLSLLINNIRMLLKDGFLSIIESEEISPIELLKRNWLLYYYMVSKLAIEKKNVMLLLAKKKFSKKDWSSLVQTLSKSFHNFNRNSGLFKK